MLNRSGFKSRNARPSRPAREWTADELPTPRAQPLRISDQRAVLCVPLPKSKPKRNEAYRRWVAGLDCAHCKRPGPSQCAHGDAGKGMGIKADDDTCYPACADSPGRQGCHALIGSSGKLTQAQRRLLELMYAEETQAKAKAAGAWPKDWPL